jgi:hypothetical protein
MDFGLLPAGWQVRLGPLVPPRRGLCEFLERRITIAERLGPVECRCVLAHEVQHAIRGPVPGFRRESEERIVNDLAARQLIGIEDLMRVILLEPGVAAEELEVDVQTLSARLDGLTKAERDRLQGSVPDFVWVA